MYMKKLVIVINGAGGVGKDTLCDHICQRICSQNVSSIDPVKKIAKAAGWNGEKTPDARLFLSNLKRLMIDFNDAPTTYLLEKYRCFIHSSDNILFCHIREPEEIDKFKSKVNTAIATMIIKRDTGVEHWGNKSDDDVFMYNYDFTFNNNGPLDETKVKFEQQIRGMLEAVPEIETMDYPM